MNDSGSGFLILGFVDPHGLEGGKGAEDGSSDPDQEFPLSRGNNLDLHGGGGKGGDFLAETLGNAGVHGGSTTHDDVAIEVLSDVDVALEDGLVGDFVEAGHFLADHHGLEEGLGASKPLGGNGDDLSIGQLVGLVILVGAVVG